MPELVVSCDILFLVQQARILSTGQRSPEKKKKSYLRTTSWNIQPWLHADTV